jgi:hypothetical protein
VQDRARPVRWRDDERRMCGSNPSETRTRFWKLRRKYTTRRKDEKDTKTHQIRRISLDSATAGILVAQFRRYEDRLSPARWQSSRGRLHILVRARQLAAVQPGWIDAPATRR